MADRAGPVETIQHTCCGEASAFFLQHAAAMRKVAPLLLLALGLTACNGDGDDSKGASPDRTAARAPADSGPRTVFPEPQAVQVLRVIDSARIASAQAARERSLNASILEFARVMIADHRAITRVVDSLMTATGQTPAENELSQDLRAANEHFLSELMARDSGFNNGYIGREVSDHEYALALLDTALIPSARNPQLKTALEQLRPAFEAHLQRAQQIQAARRAAAARPAPVAAPTPAPAPAVTPPPVTPPPDTFRRPPPTDTMRPPPPTTTNM